MTTFPTANPGGTLPDKEPGVHRWVMVASYTVSPEEAAAAAMGEPVVMDLAHLFTTPEVGCLDCEERYADAWTEPCPAGDEWPTPPAVPLDVDSDALVADVDVLGRSGATGFEVGYLHDDVPMENADWWASATYQGVKVHVEHHRSPAAATEALVRRLLVGGLCTHCGQRVKIGGSCGKACRWYRDGRTWRRGCEETHP